MFEPYVEAISRRIAVNISEFFRKISESFRKKSEMFLLFSDFLVGSVADMLQNRTLVGLNFKRLFVPEQIYWIVEQILLLARWRSEIFRERETRYQRDHDR